MIFSQHWDPYPAVLDAPPFRPQAITFAPVGFGGGTDGGGSSDQIDAVLQFVRHNPVVTAIGIGLFFLWMSNRIVIK